MTPARIASSTSNTGWKGDVGRHRLFSRRRTPHERRPLDAERFQVPETTARLINQARAVGGRVVAVGTTSVRALETVSTASGIIYPGEGVTDPIVTSDRTISGVDGIITRCHEVGASHLDLIEAIAGRQLVERCYREAVEGSYLWHEFGDSLLVRGG